MHLLQDVFDYIFLYPTIVIEALELSDKRKINYFLEIFNIFYIFENIPLPPIMAHSNIKLLTKFHII